MSQQLFGSAEYLNKGYTPQESVLTLFRAVLSREPDPSGLSAYVNSINSGATPAQIATQLTGSSEFTNMIGSICSGSAYRQDLGGTQAIDIGSGTWTQAQLQSCINNNAVCSVPPRVVVYLNSSVTVPAGKVLETSGNPNRFQYARQARLVRNSGSFDHLLEIQSGATVRNIWLSGQRHLYKNVPLANIVQANIRYLGGYNGVIQGVRSDFPLQLTHIETANAPGSITIENNLTTGYTSSHTTSDWRYPWADGISQHTPNGTIRNNDVVDPTDVGIIIFGHDGKIQASTAYSNTIVHAGLSSYGSLAFDTTQCTSYLCSFTGNGIDNNLILAGQNQHSDIMLIVGTGPWTPDLNCGSTNRKGCGSGGKMTGNRTIAGDLNQRVKVQVGILVDGMQNAYTNSNRIDISPQNLGGCFKGPGIINHIDNDPTATHASGTLQLEANYALHGCIGH